MLDPYLADIERWLVAEPRLTALAILGRLAERCPEQFGPPQHTIVQRLLRSLRRKAAETIIPRTLRSAPAARKVSYLQAFRNLANRRGL